MNTQSKAFLIGGGIGSFAAAAFMIRDGGVPGGNNSIFEAGSLMGGSLDGSGHPEVGYSMRGSPPDHIAGQWVTYHITRRPHGTRSSATDPRGT